MNLAILGATSQIAKDLIISFSVNDDYQLTLFARRPDAVNQWLEKVNLSGRFIVADFDSFTLDKKFDAILNFVGVGDPAQAAAMGASIFDVTLNYDQMALDYLKAYPECRYLFLSSGAAYGSGFDKPADDSTKANIAINDLQPQNWYGVAKLHAECRHRALLDLSIIDIRVFNCFSHTQDMSARFLITDIVRAIRDKTVLKTSSDYIVRDFIHSSDFYNLVIALLTSPATNTVVDCYSKAPIDKPTLLVAMHEKYGLQYDIVHSAIAINATGSKPYYYSLYKEAANFGYHPTMTSLEGIIVEMNAVLLVDG